MNPEIKAKWVEALRSGKYEQGRDVLRTTDNKFCCLGVLADIRNPEGWRSDPQTIGTRGGRLINGFGWRDFLPDDLLSLPDLGIDLEDQLTLVDMNDHGRSFDEIADYIERHL